MTFSSNQTNFEHTFGAKVTFYKGIDAEDITAKKVTINGQSDSKSLIVRETSNLSTLSVSSQTTLLNLNVTGIATANHLTINGELRDGDGDFGSTGQVLSSDGTDTKWINTSDANVGSATNVGTNENATDASQYVTFVGAKTGNNPIRVDEGIKYNPSTNVLTLGSLSLGGSSSGGVIPSGGIILWSGATDNIPNGWALCDGENNTPDLRDRFVIGAGSAYDVDATGGSADATLVSHFHTVDNHTHSFSATTDNNTHNHGITDPGHIHNVAYSNSDSGDGVIEESGVGLSGYEPTESATTGITINNNTHNHPVSGTTDGSTPQTNSQGSSATDANLPPYYALAYIMKT